MVNTSALCALELNAEYGVFIGIELLVHYVAFNGTAKEVASVWSHPRISFIVETIIMIKSIQG